MVVSELDWQGAGTSQYSRKRKPKMKRLGMLAGINRFRSTLPEKLAIKE
jgi:hypothetical protein